MGLFDSIRKKEKMEKGVGEYFKLMNAYTPAFTSFEGGIYEMELTRAAIHSFANHCSKLKPIVNGSGNVNLERMLQYRPNALMDTKKYLYRLATVLSVDNTAFIAPLYGKNGDVIGYYPLLTEKCALVQCADGKKYIRYTFDEGNYGALEIERIGIMNQFQYRNELFGESNKCLAPTMDLMDTNNQGIIQGVKNSASIRFMAKLAMTLKDTDIEKERERFTSSNLGSNNNGGVLMFDQKYQDVKQIESKPFTVDADQMKNIKESVYNYFGTNEAIMQNKYTSDEWNAYYEGKIEPFAIEASLVHTNITFTNREIGFGNEIIFTANRLQYLSGKEKLEIVTQLFDRGFITHNEGLEIFNMAGIGEEGDKRYIRREYVESENLDTEIESKKLEKIGEEDGNI